MSTLTNGAVLDLLNETREASVFHPTMQILDIRKIGGSANGAGGDRYRVIISDGRHFAQSMVTTQLNELIETNQLQKYSIVKLTEYICNNVQNRKIIIILGMEILQSTAEKIGEPYKVEKVLKQHEPGASDKNFFKKCNVYDVYECILSFCMGDVKMFSNLMQTCHENRTLCLEKMNEMKLWWDEARSLGYLPWYARNIIETVYDKKWPHLCCCSDNEEDHIYRAKLFSKMTMLEDLGMCTTLKATRYICFYRNYNIGFRVYFFREVM